MKNFRFILSLGLLPLMAVSLSGCLFKPYVPPVEQGTIITPAMQQAVKIGMTEGQVKAILGTPDIQDPYHPNTWYYVQTEEKNYQPRTQTTWIVQFESGRLVSMEKGA